MRRKGVNHIQELVQGSEPMVGRRGFVDTVSIPENNLSECKLGTLDFGEGVVRMRGRFVNCLFSLFLKMKFPLGVMMLCTGVFVHLTDLRICDGTSPIEC